VASILWRFSKAWNGSRLQALGYGVLGSTVAKRAGGDCARRFVTSVRRDAILSGTAVPVDMWGA